MRGMLILLLLATVVYAASTERGDWSMPLRIIWVIGCWLLHAILSAVAMLLLGLLWYLLTPGPIPESGWFAAVFEATIVILGAIPIIIWAMLRSKTFVKPAPANNQGTDSSPIPS